MDEMIPLVLTNPQLTTGLYDDEQTLSLDAARLLDIPIWSYMHISG